MPKLKTNRAAHKRFKINKKGRIKRSKAFKRHILTSKNRKLKRKLRTGVMVAPSDQKEIYQLLPYS